MRNSRPYVQIDPDVLERARQIDLLSYLRAYEPSNLVKVKGTTNQNKRMNGYSLIAIQLFGEFVNGI